MICSSYYTTLNKDSVTHISHLEVRQCFLDIRPWKVDPDIWPSQPHLAMLAMHLEAKLTIIGLNHAAARALVIAFLFFEFILVLVVISESTTRTAPFFFVRIIYGFHFWSEYYSIWAQFLQQCNIYLLHIVF